MELDHIFKFIKLTHDFQKIERVTFINQNERGENDVEHSYQLAMVAWYAVSAFKLPLNIDLVIKYGMLHDLVEVYAGDTYIFDKDSAAHETKVQREKEALDRLKLEFPEFPEMTDLITQYEKREDEESKFIYALDKVVAPINIYMDGRKLWKEKGVTLKEVMENKLPKVAEHPEVKKYFDQLAEIFKKEPDLFHQENNDNGTV